ncbi:cbb3-type cytochrome c oxidase subunit I [bacterium]|nr:cbb3-type cytochrome c oxidase subunit I [bacterium]
MHDVFPSAAEQVRRSFLGGPHGSGAWFASTDHKRISLMFMGWTMGAFLLGMILAILPQVKAVGGPGIGNRILLETVTYLRIVLVMGWLVPVLPGVIGHFVLPLQLGARNMALPGLAQASLRTYAVGLILIVASMVLGPVSSGWTLDSGLALLDPGAFGVLAVGLALMGICWFAMGVNFVVTVHHARREGMGFFDMPLTAWGFYLGGYLLVVAGGIFTIVVLYLAGSRLSGSGMFGPEADPMAWRTYFWVAMRPAAYFALVPAAGLVSDVISGVARRDSSGYRTIVGSLIALTGLGVVSYGANLIGNGLTPGGTLVFGFISLLAAVPVALIAFTWLSTLYRGSIACASPTTYSVAFILNAGFAAVLGLFIASPAVGQYLGATMFASTQLDYVMWGGVLSAFFAGAHFWWPKMMGRRYNDEVARIGAIIYLIGINLALVPQLVMGAQGVPAGFAGVVPVTLKLAEISSLGWLCVYSGLAVAAGNLLVTLWGDAAAEQNPWGATSLEWTVPSPPPEGNFDEA